MKISVKAIRTWLENNPCGDLDDCLAAFNFAPELVIKIKHLQKRGELKVHRDYVYTSPSEDKPQVDDKYVAIWRSIRALAKVRRIINKDELMTIAEASDWHLNRYLKFLKREGYIADRVTGLAVLDKTMQQPDPPIMGSPNPKSVDVDCGLVKLDLVELFAKGDPGSDQAGGPGSASEVGPFAEAGKGGQA